MRTPKAAKATAFFVYQCISRKIQVLRNGLQTSGSSSGRKVLDDLGAHERVTFKNMAFVARRNLKERSPRKHSELPILLKSQVLTYVLSPISK